MRYIAFICVCMVTGCGHINPGKNPQPVPISGRVTLHGKPVTDLNLNLQPTGVGVQAVFAVRAGRFKGDVVPGRYTYFLSEGRNPANLQAVPVAYRTGSIERQLEITGGIWDVIID